MDLVTLPTLIATYLVSVCTNTSEYHIMAATSATRVQPPQDGAALVGPCESTKHAISKHPTLRSRIGAPLRLTLGHAESSFEEYAKCDKL